MASGLKSSSRENKSGIDAAICHTVSKCLEKPLQESKPPPGAALCVQGLARLEARGSTRAVVIQGPEDKVLQSIQSGRCQKASESSCRGWPDHFSPGL